MHERESALFFMHARRSPRRLVRSGYGPDGCVETAKTVRSNGGLTKVVRESGVAMLPREKLLSGTAASELTDQELLAILLKTGTRDCNVLQLAGEILRNFGSLYDLSIADWRELKTIHGLGLVRSLELYSMFEFGRRAIKQPVQDFQKQPLDSAQKVAHLLKGWILGDPQETFYVLFLNARGYLMSEPKAMMRGSKCESTVGVSDVYREAVKRNARAIIVAHNHPNGGSSPSPADVAVTEKLIAAGVALGIELKDHIVIGGASDGDEWTSIRESGMVNFSKKGEL